MHTSSTLQKRLVVFAGLGTLLALVLVTFYPALRGGFFADDWWLVPKAGMLSLPEYLVFYFDPNFQLYWYRPAHGVLLLIEYFFFRSSPEGYHFVQVLLHALNCLLVTANVWQVSRRWRLAVLAGLFYAAFMPGVFAVYYIVIHDPLAVTFYLTSIWFWIIYLQTNRARYFGLALVACVASLLSKETSAILIVTLFLIDRLVVGRSVVLLQLMRRHGALGVIFAAYAIIALRIQSQGWFVGREGYRLGLHVFENVVNYVRLVLLPWNPETVGNYAWLGALILMAIFALLHRSSKHSSAILFLFLHTGLALAPVLGLPGILFEARYLYLPSASIAILLALFSEQTLVWLNRWGWSRVMIAAVCWCLIALQSVNTSEAAIQSAEATRQSRVWIRDLRLQHPAFPPDTHIQFVNHCLQRHITGIFFLQYGTNVTVRCPNVEFGGVDPAGPRENRMTDWRAYQNALVFYFDEDIRRHEVSADRDADTKSHPPLPVGFQEPLTLQSYQLTSRSLSQGQELALFLYWKANGAIGRDYTVFLHLVDERGNLLAGADALLNPPTSQWYVDKFMITGHVLSIPADVPVGENYRLEIGLYYLPTLERVKIVDTVGQVIADQIVIVPFTVK